MLNIYAGNSALKTIQQHGFKQDLFTNFLGASGGPKWFTLFGLDKYVFGEFFKGRNNELNLVGSSAGAFRAACFAQNDPVAAINRLAECYSHTVYSDKPTTQEITTKAKGLIDYVYGENGAQEVLNNPIFQVYFIVAKCRGLVSYEQKSLQFLGLLKSYLANRINRKYLAQQYQRMVFHNSQQPINIKDAKTSFNTQYISLSHENIFAALLASGSIPMVMEGVKNINGAPQGMYRDGGIIDYHFDIEIITNKTNNINSPSLTLYPHFNHAPKAGWFDKDLSRNPQAKHYDNVVMLVPSEKFVQSLPYQKIPDRKDFETLDAKTRINYWQTVLQQTDKLAEHLDNVINHQNIAQIKPIPF